MIFRAIMLRIGVALVSSGDVFQFKPTRKVSMLYSRTQLQNYRTAACNDTWLSMQKEDNMVCAVLSLYSAGVQNQCQISNVILDVYSLAALRANFGASLARSAFLAFLIDQSLDPRLEMHMAPQNAMLDRPQLALLKKHITAALLREQSRSVDISN